LPSLAARPEIATNGKSEKIDHGCLYGLEFVRRRCKIRHMKFLKLVFAFICVPLLSACFIVRAHQDRPIDRDKIPVLQRGVTTKKQVLELFGPPQAIDAREIVAAGDLLGVPGDHRRVEQLVAARYFRYSYYRANGWALITFAFNYVDADVKADTLIIFFDGNDVVEDYAFADDTRLLPMLGPLSR
jgi:outer membrane protein assembly factor BamE (lipoprotein component of BamABCDE complex)